MTLKSKDPKAIRMMLQQMADDAQSLIKEAISISYYMRGCVSLTEMYLCTKFERQTMASFITDRLEVELKKPMQTPVY